MVSTTALMPSRDSVPGLAARLRAARESAGLSQVQAGERSGVHHVSIAKFETDKSTPTLRVLYLLALAYEVDVCDLLPPMPK
jgi:transcriptional regulator with XRE-family HTH domain